MKDLNWQLGYVCAEHYADYGLPTLSTDLLTSDNIIPVPLSLCKESKKRKKYWRSMEKGKLRDEFFKDNLKWYEENIVREFLDEEIKTVFYVQPSNIKEFVKGFNDSLSDTGFSHYVCTGAKKGGLIGESLEVTLKLINND